MNTNNKSLKLIPVILAFLLSLNAHHTTAQVDVQDSLALVSIFNETNGNSWTNNANWLMGPPVPSWFGISTFGTRVTQIVLPNNSLTDSLPFEINTLTELTFADFNFNNISELDTINPILLHDLITFDVRNNRLDFGDFEKSLPAINAVPNFLMHPQDSVGQPKTLMRSVHDIHTFQVDVGGSMNQYQWFKNNVAIPGATDPTYTLSSLSSNDAGQYRCEISSSIAALNGVVLYSFTQHLQIGFCTDSEGGAIFCHQLSIQWEPGTTLPEKILLREEFGATVLDSCMCQYELWSLPDTVILEGPVGEVAKAEEKTRVKDADVNNLIQVSQTQSIAGAPPIDTIIQGSPGGPGEVIVSILDSGIGYTHPDLKDYIRINSIENPPGDNDGNCHVDDILGYNFIYDNNIPYDDNGHGTHVAGIVKQGIPIGQIALLNLKIADSLGIGSVYHAICGIEYSIQKDADILNLSWGYQGVLNTTLFEVLRKAAEDCGTLIVASAGNESTDNDNTPHYPSGFDIDNIISVAATNAAETQLAPFSNFGASSVDIAAPGTNILSTIPHAAMGNRSGTSMAAAEISNIAAKMYYQNPGATYKGVKHCLLNEVIPNPMWSDSLLSSGKASEIDAINCIDTSAYATICGTVYDIRTFLEGPFDGIGGMGDSLRSNGLIPLAQPYNLAPWNYGGSETTSVPELMITGDEAIVDWVLIRRVVETDSGPINLDTAALLRRNGSITGTDGNPLILPPIPHSKLGVIHLNHLAVITEDSVNESTQPVTIHFDDPAFAKEGDTPMKLVGTKHVMFSGDANADGSINAVDQNLFWRIQNGSAPAYTNSADFNLDGQVNAVDRNIFFAPNNSVISFCDQCYE